MRERGEGRGGEGGRERERGGEGGREGRGGREGERGEAREGGREGETSYPSFREDPRHLISEGVPVVGVVAIGVHHLMPE